MMDIEKLRILMVKIGWGTYALSVAPARTAFTQAAASFTKCLRDIYWIATLILMAGRCRHRVMHRLNV